MPLYLSRLVLIELRGNLVFCDIFGCGFLGAAHCTA